MSRAGAKALPLFYVLVVTGLFLDLHDGVDNNTITGPTGYRYMKVGTGFTIGDSPYPPSVPPDEGLPPILSPWRPGAYP